jgi:hypothetical protein
MTRATSFFLAMIFALALGLRVWGIGFGLPYAYHADEPTYVSQALNLGAGIIGRQPNPTAFSNILFGEYAGYFLTGRLIGLFSSTAAFEQAYRVDPSVFLLLSRLTSALFGAGSVVIVYFLGARSTRRTVGLVAALFLAVSFLHVRDSHYGVPDVVATFFICLTVLFSIVAYQKWGLRYLCYAAASAGFAAAAKWSVWQVGIPPLIMTVAYVRHQIRQATATKSKLALNLFLVGLCLAGGFALGGFQLLLRPGTYLEYALREARAGEAGGFGFWQIDTLPGWNFYLNTLLYGLGAILLILGIAGLARRTMIAARHRDLMSVILISFPLLYFLVMGSTQHYFARYALPLVPFIALFAAEFAIAAYDWLMIKKPSLARAITAILIVGALATPLLNSIQHDVLLTKVDTRTLAKQWIEASLPAGAKIAADWPIHTPALAAVDSTVANDSAKAYQVQYIGGSGLSDHPLEWYQKQGFEYLIASSFIYDIPLVFPKQGADRKKFYGSLPQQAKLLKEFSASPEGIALPFLFDEIYGPAISLWQRERPGPTIKIYQLERN